MFTEGLVEAGGVRLRYVEAGQGAPLVHLSGPGAPRPTAADELLARHFRVLALEAPGGSSVDGLGEAITRLGVESFDLIGSSRGAEAALRLALQEAGRVRALVLEAPTVGGGDLEPRLPRIAAPTLVLLGTRDATAAALGRVCQTQIPACHLVFVYDAVHAIGAERPEAFAEVVADFLERHEAFVISRARTVIHP